MDQPKRSNVSDAKLQRMDELKEIIDKIQAKNQGSKYTPEQLHCWTNLIHNKKHDVLPTNLFSASKGSLLLVCRVLENALDYAHSVLTSWPSGIKIERRFLMRDAQNNINVPYSTESTPTLIACYKAATGLPAHPGVCLKITPRN